MWIVAGATVLAALALEANVPLVRLGTGPARSVGPEAEPPPTCRGRTAPAYGLLSADNLYASTLSGSLLRRARKVRACLQVGNHAL